MPVLLFVVFAVAGGAGADDQYRREGEGVGRVRGLGRGRVASPTPAVLRGKHVELARPRVPRAGGVVGSYEVVAAEPLDTGDDRHTPLGGRERPRLAQVVRSASTARSKAPPCSS